MTRRSTADPAALAAWRLAQLDAAGFPAPLAARLARDLDMDLHALLALVDRGCPPTLAVRILAPLDAPDPWPT
ncbi:hypothetical protein [Capillimicrobium parvum]|uniref:Uncharacterized protein n=1 Tax=Capillimicrobium parvum TaxID=2884022 RepID=A0A9E6XYV9_9ACTN|nr:hypothetical protein [Capillimicrobium parvum]UGS36563.1 hypothetical protein DSM104329_02969 [Capillimicrobium parvum]